MCVFLMRNFRTGKAFRPRLTVPGDESVALLIFLNNFSWSHYRTKFICIRRCHGWVYEYVLLMDKVLMLVLVYISRLLFYLSSLAIFQCNNSYSITNIRYLTLCVLFVCNVFNIYINNWVVGSVTRSLPFTQWFWN